MYQLLLNSDGTPNEHQVQLADPDTGALTLVSDGTWMWNDYLAWVAAGNTPTPVPATPLAQLVAQLSDDIDSQVATAYATWTRFQAEYEAREAAAQAFAAANYVGDPGTWVSAYATAAGVTNQQAAMTILGQAAALNGALSAIGAQRMRKYEVLSAPDAATAQSIHDDIILRVNTIIAGVS